MTATHGNAEERTWWAFRELALREASTAGILGGLATLGAILLPEWWRLPVLLPALFVVSLVLRQSERRSLIVFTLRGLEVGILQREIPCHCVKFRRHVMVCDNADCDIRHFVEGEDNAAATA